MKRTIALCSVLAVVVAVLALLYEGPDPVRPPAAYTGAWEGRCGTNEGGRRLPDLDVDIEISMSGAVTGRVGGAVLSDGRFLENGPAQIWFGKPRYIIRAGLRGYPYRDRDVTLDSIVVLPPEIGEGRSSWYFYSTGAGGERMITSDRFEMFKRAIDPLSLLERRSAPGGGSSRRSRPPSHREG